MKLGKALLRQLVDKVVANRDQRGSIVASDQGSHRGHQCSKTSLKGEPSFIVNVGASPEREPMPLSGSKWLTHRTNETVYWSEAAGSPQWNFSNFTVG
jgi:hypothetical protein